MRTTFDAHNQRSSEPLGRHRISLLLLLVFFALGLILLDGQGYLDPVKSRVHATMQPIVQTLTQTRLAIGEMVGSVTGQGALQQKLEEQERTLSALREENIRLKDQLQKLPMLEQELEIRTTYDWDTIAATVVRSTTDSGRRIIRIDQGDTDGIRTGMAVVAKEGGSPAALIGVVEHVYAQTSDVLLITDYGFSISASTAGTDEPARGIIVGQWQVGSRIKLTEVTRDVPLAVNHYVVTSGLSRALATETPLAQVPPGVPIGTIINVDQSGNSQTAEVQPFVDPDRVRNVWVIADLK